MIDERLLSLTVRENIINIRTGNADTKFSQERLGEILGLSRSAVANLETGKQRISLHNVYAICDHLKLDLMDILPDVEDMRDKGSSTKEPKSNNSVENAVQKMKERK